MICDLSTCIIEGHTSVTQITGNGLKREQEQQRRRFASRVVKYVLASSDCASKETGVNMIQGLLGSQMSAEAIVQFVTQDPDVNSARGIMSSL